MTAESKTQIKSYFETLKKEEWRVIPGHEPYEASNLGRIKSPRGNVLQPVKWGNRGHVAVRTGGGRGARRYYVHHLVLKAWKGPKPEGAIGCHKDDCKTLNTPENLYWGTYKSNTEDAIRNGKFTYCDPMHTTKYSPETVTNILNEYTGKRGEQTLLSNKYGMSVSNIHLIVHGKSRVK